jgi:hypothetical protein
VNCSRRTSPILITALDRWIREPEKKDGASRRRPHLSGSSDSFESFDDGENNGHSNGGDIEICNRGRYDGDIERSISTFDVRITNDSEHVSSYLHGHDDMSTHHDNSDHALHLSLSPRDDNMFEY